MRTRSLALTSGFVLLLSLGLTFGDDKGPEDKFAQLAERLPTPNDQRTASGAPGKGYWQQRANYEIEVTLDETEKRITGKERIRYHNHSPDTLAYLWVQIDPNIFSPESHAVLTQLSPELERMSYDSLRRNLTRASFDGGAEILSVQDADGQPLAHTIVDTMMRIDLAKPLARGEQVGFSIAWTYLVNDSKKFGGRTGYEQFDEDGNAIFELAQWFPRMAAYTDYTGWQHKQFLGAGEFTLEFGDYRVSITVPADHVVASTGVLQNPEAVLEPAWKERLESARTAGSPQFVVTPEEARANEKERATETKTWTFAAENVRDFAWASSRKFIWDAVLHRVEDKDVWAMSFYPNEGEPLWSKYSTQAIVHTLDVYSRHTFPYPYPVAISVNGPVGGMEYPMICFNGPRPEKDGTYSSGSKYGLISVVIHEVGHNFFPMIVNSDERQWTWMDEGLNTFLQNLAEQAWEDDYPSYRGEPRYIASYMKSEDQVPIMTNSDSVLQFGSNAYSKPATALNVLRETVMGRELFDFAFQQYARRWMFKRPEPADLFRTLEDASAVDLDWFWNGWFYTTRHVDMALGTIQHWRIDTRDPELEKRLRREKREAEPRSLADQRNEAMEKRIERVPELADFYNAYDELDVTDKEREDYAKLLEGLGDEDEALLAKGLHFYVVPVEDQGGLPMPITLGLEYEDGSREDVRIPVEVWRKNPTSVKKLVVTPKVLVRATLDPYLESADAELADNVWPPALDEKTFQLQESGGGGGRRGRGGPNPMRDALEAEKKKAEESKPVEAASGPGSGG
jgi:peptidase M1-like protein